MTTPKDHTATQGANEREALKAFERLLDEQKWVLGMPKLAGARPAFVSGYLAALAQRQSAPADPQAPSQEAVPDGWLAEHEIPPPDSTLGRMGSRLAGLLDEGQWAEIEPMLFDVARQLAREALDARRYRAKRSIDENNFVKSAEYMRQPVAVRDMMLAGWLASYDAAIDAAIAKGEQSHD